ncbi:MAG: P-type conjugative transfer ATPase TrbB [Cetobacterium sp.]
MNREITKTIYNDRLFQILKTAFGVEINSYFENQDIIEILLNNNKQIWVDSLSKGMYQTDIILENSSAMKIINTIATASNSIVDKQNSIISSELPESGFRFEAIIPPNVNNPIFAIRKSSVLVFTLNDYVKMGVITEKQKNIIEVFIESYQNILIVGGTSSGKTTFANACIASIPKGDRLVILEDTQEIKSLCPNSVHLKTSIYKTMEDLFYSTMRLRPTRIIVGEIRGSTSIDLLTAWNSGHGGGISTIHSDSAEGALQQLEQYNQRKSIDKQQSLIGKAVDLIIVLQKIRGKRMVVEIKKVIKFENGKYILEEVE